ncbi:MAG: DinB family protein [Acidobacteria bacterium]|nr:DinB family protein [Acidobacteriota bacterium]
MKTPTAPPAYTTLLEEALEAWGYTRTGVIDELKNIPADKMTFRPTPEMRSVAELGLHILESGLLMVGELARPDGSFRRASYAALLKEHAGSLPSRATKPELLAELKSTHRGGEKRFRQAGELWMMQYITRFDGLPGSRFAWMQHGIAHEEYHRGQLALYARLLGLVPALTQQIMG